MKIEELCFAVTILCTVIKNVVSNRPPRFSVGGDMAHFSIPENVDVGSTVYKLRGSDPEGTTVHFSISGEYFSVNKYTGDVTLIKELDRELSSSVEVIISITDEASSGAEANTVSIRREIPIIDVNDNPPVFGNSHYSLSVSEDTKVGTIVYSNITISDRDFGPNSMVNLFCVQSPACQIFQVSLQIISEGSYRGIITLVKPLNYEIQSSHTLWLKAIDSNPKKPLSATAKIIIDVEDIQDQKPMFFNTPYSISVPENTPPNKKVLTVEARDGDVKNLRPILFSLEEDVLHYFSIQNHGNGNASIITTDTPIDREDPAIVQMGGIYTFYVKATEMVNKKPADSSRELITIVILDQNDHLPKFNKPVFSVHVSEDIGVGTPIPGLGIITSDDDMGDNARFSLALRSNYIQFVNWFSVEPVQVLKRSPVIVRVVNNTGLDYESGIREIKLYVIAFVQDGKNESMEVASSEIILFITDVNDNHPQFPKNNYVINISEDTKPGTVIANITAFDQDSGLFSEITYSVGGFGMDKFDTDFRKGGLILVNQLDYEQQISYSLTLEARDGGNKTTTANIVVNVIDINDNAPVFEQAEYRRNIRDGLSSFQPQFFVKATDNDGLSYKQITYSIISSNSDAVGINSATGEIKMLKPANSQHTSRGQYELKIQANDSGDPALISQVLVFIRVGLPGNQRPIFKGTPYNVTIPETIPPNSFITSVRASDPDGLDETLEYKMVAGADHFYIKPRSGLIYLAENADLSSSFVKRYDITVLAIDSGIPYRETAQTTVTINLLDVNDKPPAFIKDMNYVSYTSEKMPVGSVVMHVQAVDPDENADLRYSFLNPFKVTDRRGFYLKDEKNNYNALFKIDEKTGEISIQRPLENLPIHVVTMTVEVQDKNATENIKSQIDSVEVTIFIEATEEMKPVFSNSGLMRSNPVIIHNMLEELPIGSNILTLAAVDPFNQMPIRNFEAKLLPRQLAMDRLGNIVLTERIDYETIPSKKLHFLVEAITNDYKKRSQANVTINIIDINDHIPQFDHKFYQSSVEENSKQGTFVLSVHASDGDLKISPQGYGNITYRLSGEHAFLFEINSTSGDIKVGNNIIDREKQPVLNLIAIAADTPLGGKDTRKSEVPIQIDVLDINDNYPSFKEKEYAVVVLENIKIGASVLNISASDPDIGSAGILKYDLIVEPGDSGFFNINAETGEITVQKSLTGRGRNLPYLMRVRAEDQGDPVLFKDVQITVLISDVVSNDGVPIFIQPKENEVAFISEDVPVGSVVFQVKGTDPDDLFTPEGQLQYSFLQDSADVNAFSIHPTTGLINTRIKLDRETKANYSLILLIKDGGIIPQQTTRILSIKVNDIDDNLPFFKRSVDEKPLQIEVEEEQPLGSVVGFIDAIDFDEKQNAEIDYLITEGNEDGFFSISESNNSAILQIAARIDREKISHVLLTIKCFRKRDKPKMLHKKYNRTDFSERQINIRIQDIDDNFPEFTEKNITVGIRFNALIDTVLLTVTAEDMDAEAEPIMYYIANVTFLSLNSKSLPSPHLLPFILNNRTGELRTNSSLRKFVDGYFVLEVAGINSYTKYSINYVKIYVIRERGLYKFVFSKSPSEVKEYLPQFKLELESALTVPSVQVNLYETQFHSKQDGSFDFSKTGSCFQIINDDYSLKDVENIFKDENNELLKQVFDKYYVESIQACGSQSDKSNVTWVQISLLSIATLIGIISVISTCILCCSYNRWQRLR